MGSAGTVERNCQTMQFRIKSLLALILLIAMVFAAVRAYDIAFVSQSEETQIVTGMTRKEVVAILGEPHWQSEGDHWWHYQCDYPHFLSDNLNIAFDENDKVDWMSR